jgi:hypothetical protein
VPPWPQKEGQLPRGSRLDGHDQLASVVAVYYLPIISGIGEACDRAIVPWALHQYHSSLSIPKDKMLY